MVCKWVHDKMQTCTVRESSRMNRFLAHVLTSCVALPSCSTLHLAYETLLCFKIMLQSYYAHLLSSFLRSHRLALACLISSIVFAAVPLFLQFNLVLHSARFKILKPYTAKENKKKKRGSMSRVQPLTYLY